MDTVKILREGAFKLRMLSDQNIWNNYSNKLLPAAVIELQNQLDISTTAIAHTVVDAMVEIEGDILSEKEIEAKYGKKIATAYQQSLRDIYLTGEQEIIKSPKITLTESPITEKKLNKLIRDRTFRASEFTLNNLKGDIFQKIAESIRLGLSQDKTREQIRTEFRPMAEYQLQRIARTESHSVYNQSKYETLLQNEKLVNKRWLSSGLPNMRQWHEEADGQSVPVDEPFIVWDEDLMYPGDPEGSPGNIINCACTMIPDITKGEKL
jgi:hypothetical protein